MTVKPLPIAPCFPADDGWAWRRHPESEGACSLMTSDGHEAARVTVDPRGEWSIHIPDSNYTLVDAYATKYLAVRQAEYALRPCATAGCDALRERGSCRCAVHGGRRAFLPLSIPLNVPLCADATRELRAALAAVVETTFERGSSLPNRCVDPETRRYAWFSVSLAFRELWGALDEWSNPAEVDRELESAA